MSQNPGAQTCIAFADAERIALGPIEDVARAARERLDRGDEPTVLVFDAETSRPVELDLRGTADEVVERLRKAEAAMAAAREAAEKAAPRGPGRPKLGVVAREVTLLPRHWEWLSAQPGGASVTLRKLVERARSEDGGDRKREATDATYRFMLAMAGNEPGYEEANRALYRGDRDAFEALVEVWPADVRDHVLRLASEAFSAAK